MISVITVSYNSSPHIRETIESVLAQHYTDFEYVIGDDCSSDDTWQIIQSYADHRIKSYRNESNLKEYGNRNKAVDHASGEYVIFIDGDDYMYPHALSVFSYYIKLFPECSMFFSREWDHRILYPYKVLPRTFYQFEYFDKGIMGGNFTNVVFKRKDIIEAGYFAAHIRSGDTYLQLKIGRSKPSVAIPQGLTWWRKREGNATSELFKDNRHLAETFGYRLKLLDEDCPLSTQEIELAKTNIYGLYMRMLIRLVLKLKFGEVNYLLKRLNIPPAYWKSILVPSKTQFFDHVTGDRPLHSSVNKTALPVDSWSDERDQIGQY